MGVSRLLARLYHSTRGLTCLQTYRRVVRTCCLCCCYSDYTRSGKDLHDALSGRTTKTCKVMVALFCLGVVAGSTYGMLKAGPHAVLDALQVFDNVKVRSPAWWLISLPSHTRQAHQRRHNPISFLGGLETGLCGRWVPHG